MGKNTNKASQLTGRALLHHNARALDNQVVRYMSLNVVSCNSKQNLLHLSHFTDNFSYDIS